jgi:hypothetical protein
VIAFVLSGGGTLGAAQAGMREALFERDFVPDVLVGTSIGAANAAFLAAEPTLSRAQELSQLWRSLKSREIFPLGLLRTLRALRAGGRCSPPVRYADSLNDIPPTRTSNKHMSLYGSSRPISRMAPRSPSIRIDRRCGAGEHRTTRRFPPSPDVGSYVSGWRPCRPRPTRARDSDGGGHHLRAVLRLSLPPSRNHRSAPSVWAHSIGILQSQRIRIDTQQAPTDHPELKIVSLPPVCSRAGLREFTRAASFINQRGKSRLFLSANRATPVTATAALLNAAAPSEEVVRLRTDLSIA